MVEVEIYSRSDDPNEQYWEIPPEPRDYKNRRRIERARQKTSPGHQDVELTKYANQEWFRRLNGFWFMNNGIPTYLTGEHYFYLAHWTLDTGPPEFRHTDLQLFYFWASCVEDPRCAGMCNYANRRSGKSFRGGCILYNSVSKRKSVKGGVQSKTDKDAEKFFQKCVIRPYTKLKDFFVPIFDRQLGRAPKSLLRFYNTNETGQAATDEFTGQEALESEIDFRESSAKAYDGEKELIIVEDEFGKLQTEVKLMERHQTVLFCIQESGRYVGKLLYITTVEQMGSLKNIEESRELFDGSDPTNRPANDQTKTGLYRFRLPAYETLIFDKFGMPRVEEAKKMLQARADVFLSEGDFVGYASFKRKQPFNDDDIFRVAAKSPIYDIIKIQAQTAVLSSMTESELYKRGNFIWEGGARDTRVRFVEVKNGRFLVRQLLENEAQDLQRPKNKHRFAGGCDPFEQVAAEKPSDGAGYVYKKFDAESMDMENEFIVEYCARPHPDVFFEDMIKMSVYYGMELLVENNKTGLIKYMEDRGYGAFLKRYEGSKKAGIHAGDASKQQASEKTAIYINNNCHKIFFPKLLNDFAMFDLADSTRFDRAMAAMWTLYNVGNMVSKEDIVGPTVEVDTILRMHKLR